MDLLSFKALHIVGFVAWFAGLFYLVRLFVYHAEALKKSPPERDILVRQYTLMEQRLFRIITRPAMIITFIGGTVMLIINPTYLQESWMHIKLTLVILLGAYTDWCGVILKKMAKGEMPLTAKRFRIFNEIPTVFLVAIVMLAVFRNRLSLVALIASVVGLILLLGLFFYFYSKRQKKKEPE